MLRFLDRLLILTALVLASGSSRALGESAPSQDADAPPATAKASNQNGYEGTAVCARCHRGIASSFARASMGHSLTPITPEVLKTLPLGSPETTSLFDAKSNHHFDVGAENDKLIQSEYETGANGQGDLPQYT